MNKTWYERAKQLMKSKSIKQDALIETFDVKTRGAVGHYLTGRRSPTGEQLTALAAKLNCSLDWLLTGEDFIEGEVIRPVLPGPNTTFEPNVKPYHPKGKDVPLISYVQAGQFCEAIDNFAPGDAEDWLPCPVQHGKHAYALRVQGDSMTSPYPNARSYPEGTLVYIDPEVEPLSGDRVIAKIDASHDVTFKTYRIESGKKWLIPINPVYDKVELIEGMHICGVLIFSGTIER